MLYLPVEMRRCDCRRSQVTKERKIEKEDQEEEKDQEEEEDLQVSRDPFPVTLDATSCYRCCSPSSQGDGRITLVGSHDTRTPGHTLATLPQALLSVPPSPHYRTPLVSR
ncbi:hypothetical protein E2C01_000409 [Portunus trituberculatus]|uniref:Uncharacterized protein n=1 Tax=Portunus trituberculatus TaxID=210409 RepID=A0A5B7CE05_PORTR|nr:hypothetical protein [Portunus trituberculatus]